MNLVDRRKIYNGFGDTLARAFEMVATPSIFGVFGYALDRWLGLTPVLTVVFVLLALAGMGARMYYCYEADMKRQEAESPWAPLERGAS